MVMLRILFVAEYFFSHPDLVGLATELAQRKHRISAVTSLRGVDKCRYENGVSVFEVNPFLTIHSIPHSLSFPLSKIYRIVQERDIEIIHASMDYSTNTACAAFVSRLTNIPFVYTVLGIGTRTNRLLVNILAELYDRTIDRLISRKASKTILLSQSLISRTRKLGIKADNLTVIPSGVDHNYFNPKHPKVKNKAAKLRDELNIRNNIILGYVGRLVPAKGLIYLFLAAKQIQQKYPEIALLVVGDGPYRADLEIISEELKIKTIFTGWRADTLPYYAVMDIFVLPSLFEGLSNVMLEAMAMEKPVVATNVGGNVDLITNEENGFLVPVQDHKQIAHAVEELIENPELRMRMGSINRRIVKKTFSWHTIVPKVEKVYCEVCNPQKN